MDRQVSNILASLTEEAIEIPTATTFTESPIGVRLTLRPGFNVNITIYDFIKLLEDNDIIFYTFRIAGEDFFVTENMIDIATQGSDYLDYNREHNLGLYIYLGQTINDIYEILTDFYHNLGIDNMPETFILIKSLNKTTYDRVFDLFGDEAKISYGSISSIMFVGYWLIIDIDQIKDIMTQINTQTTF